MAKKKTETKDEKIEREYTIPLRPEWRKVPRYKRSAKAVKAVKEFLVRHMKIRDRDLSKIKVDTYLNEAIWTRGIKKPPIKIQVKAVREGDIIRVELLNFPEKLKYKKVREEKQEKIAKESGEKKKSLMQKAKEGIQKKPSETTEEKIEEKNEEKEKKAAVVEAGKEMEKVAAKQMKHSVSGKTKQKTQPQRKALAK